MKTTVEIPDSLLREAKQYAAKEGISLRTVVERGLEMALRRAPRSSRRFRLKTVTTKGEAQVCDGSWSTIRSLIYDGHGG